MKRRPVSVGEKKAAKTFNDLFHSAGILPSGEQLQIGEGRDYCACCMDEDGNECDPFNVPDGFWPTTVAIHLGKRVG